MYRLYREEDLQVRQKSPKQRVSVKTPDKRPMFNAPNVCWAMDFVLDQLVRGHRFRVLTIVDPYSKVSPALGVGRQYRGHDLVETLEQATREQGAPPCIRVDNAPEFISHDLNLWAYTRGVQLDFSRPGKPTDNAFVEAFNGRCRQECLNQHRFRDMREAQTTVEAWRQDYNRCRPHGALGDLTPVEFLQQAVESRKQETMARKISQQIWSNFLGREQWPI